MTMMMMKTNRMLMMIRGNTSRRKRNDVGFVVLQIIRNNNITDNTGSTQTVDRSEENRGQYGR